MDKIILLGYMGSGKSTIAQIIASRSQLELLDLDSMIEQKCGLTIPQIFEQHGEIFFRKIEHELLKEILSHKNNFVLALGGGTPCYANNHILLESGGVLSVYLKASINTLRQRLIDNTLQRPLLSHIPDAEQHEYIAKHLFDRSFFYNTAKLKVSTDGKSAEQVADEIMASSNTHS